MSKQNERVFFTFEWISKIKNRNRTGQQLAHVDMSDWDVYFMIMTSFTREESNKPNWQCHTGKIFGSQRLSKYISARANGCAETYTRNNIQMCYGGIGIYGKVWIYY